MGKISRTYTHLKYTVKLPYKCIQIRQSNKYRKLLLQKSQQCLFLSMYSFLCLSLGPFQIYLQFWFLLFAIEERRPFCLDIRRGGLLEGGRKQKKNQELEIRQTYSSSGTALDWRAQRGQEKVLETGFLHSSTSFSWTSEIDLKCH